MGGHFLLQGIFLTQGLNPGLLHCRQILYHLSSQGSQGFLLNPGLFPETVLSPAGTLRSKVKQLCSRVICWRHHQEMNCVQTLALRVEREQCRGELRTTRLSRLRSKTEQLWKANRSLAILYCTLRHVKTILSSVLYSTFVPFCTFFSARVLSRLCLNTSKPQDTHYLPKSPNPFRSS